MQLSPASLVQNPLVVSYRRAMAATRHRPVSTCSRTIYPSNLIGSAGVRHRPKSARARRGSAAISRGANLERRLRVSRWKKAAHLAGGASAVARADFCASFRHAGRRTLATVARPRMQCGAKLGNRRNPRVGQAGLCRIQMEAEARGLAKAGPWESA